MESRPNPAHPSTGLRVPDTLGCPRHWFRAAHWHHDRNRYGGNYANLSPMMDILFGTYTCPNHEPEAFGIEEETSDNYVRQLLVDPFKADKEI